MMNLKITPSVQTIVKPAALGPVANTDTKLLIDGLLQKGRVLAQDAIRPARRSPDSLGYFESHSAYACTSIIGTVPLN